MSGPPGTKLTYKTVLEEIEGKQFHPVYFVFGQEAHLMDHLLEQLARGYLGEIQREINYFVRYAPETPIEEVVTLLTGGGLFSRKKLVVYKAIQNLRTQKFQHVMHFSEHPLPEVCLILMARTDSPPRKFHALMEKACSVRVPPASAEELLAFIRSAFQKQGKRITPPAIQTLIYHVGERLHDLQMEIVQIANFFQEKEVIGPEDVEQIVGVHVNQTVFDLTRFIAQREREKALRSLQNLLAKGESPQTILYFLIRHFLILWKIQGYYQSGVRNDREIQEKLKLYRSHFRAYKQQLKYWKWSNIVQAFQRIRWADEQLKSGSVSPDLVLDILMLQLIN